MMVVNGHDDDYANDDNGDHDHDDDDEDDNDNADDDDDEIHKQDGTNIFL